MSEAKVRKIVEAKEVGVQVPAVAWEKHSILWVRVETKKGDVVHRFRLPDGTKAQVTGIGSPEVEA